MSQFISFYLSIFIYLFIFYRYDFQLTSSFLVFCSIKWFWIIDFYIHNLIHIFYILFSFLLFFFSCEYFINIYSYIIDHPHTMLSSFDHSLSTVPRCIFCHQSLMTGVICNLDVLHSWIFHDTDMLIIFFLSHQQKWWTRHNVWTSFLSNCLSWVKVAAAENPITH